MAKTTETPDTAPAVEGDQPTVEKTGAEAPPVVTVPEPTPAPSAPDSPTAADVAVADTFTPHELGPDALAEYTATVDADGDGVPDVEQGEVIETWPAEFRPEPADVTISAGSLALAEFYGTQTPEPSPGQPSVAALEDFLRSHAVGGTSRKTEGFYGPKTRALVNAAHAHYLPDELEVTRNGVVSPALAAAMKAAGAPIGA